VRPAYWHLAVVSTPQDLRLRVAAHPAGELRRLIREDRLVRRHGHEERLHCKDRARIWLENPDSAGRRGRVWSVSRITARGFSSDSERLRGHKLAHERYLFNAVWLPERDRSAGLKEQITF